MVILLLQQLLVEVQVLLNQQVNLVLNSQLLVLVAQRRVAKLKEVVKIPDTRGQ